MAKCWQGRWRWWRWRWWWRWWWGGWWRWWWQWRWRWAVLNVSIEGNLGRIIWLQWRGTALHCCDLTLFKTLHTTLFCTFKLFLILCNTLQFFSTQTLCNEKWNTLHICIWLWGYNWCTELVLLDVVHQLRAGLLWWAWYSCLSLPRQQGLCFQVFLNHAE